MVAVFLFKEDFVGRPLILDISFYQDNPDTEERIVDFKKMKSSGVSGVIFRVGQATWEDKKFVEYWRNSETSGLSRGAYWYYDNSVDPKIQARKCISILNKMNAKLEMPLFADFEDKRTSLPYHGWKKWYEFLEELGYISDYNLGIYSNYYYWMENRPKGSESFRDKYFGSYPLWLAQYPYENHRNEDEYKNPNIPSTWNTWEFWQVSDRGNGRFHGVESSRVDVNYFNGTVEEFNSKYGINYIPPKEEPNPVKPEIHVSGQYGNKTIIYKEI